MAGYTRLGFPYPQNNDTRDAGAALIQAGFEAVDNRLGPAHSGTLQSLVFSDEMLSHYGAWTDMNTDKPGAWNNTIFTAPPSGMVQVVVQAEIQADFYAEYNPSGNLFALNFRVIGFGGYGDSQKNRYALKAFTTVRFQAATITPLSGLNPGTTYTLVTQYYQSEGTEFWGINYGSINVFPVPAG